MADSVQLVDNPQPWGDLNSTQNNLTYVDTTGIKYDFNYGFEFRTPKDDVVWHLKLWNDETGDLLITQMIPSNSYFSTPFKYYIKWRVEITSKLGTFTHTMDLYNKYVAFKMAHRTLGDCIAYMSQIPYFVKKHHCKPIIFAQKWFIDLFAKQYPEYVFDVLENESTYKDIYATYYIGLIHDKEQSRFWEKVSFKQKGLQHQAAHILGLPDNVEPEPPKVAYQLNKHVKKYVCISYSGSKACKMWANPVGWKGVIKHLKNLGYEVVCIDRDYVLGMPGAWFYAPSDCVHDIGNKPLQERIDMIANAQFFIGMASGLSWLAWCCHTPVIMISGFSRPSAEFYTPYRVYNEEAPCIDCWGDESIPFNAHDFSWCPRMDKKIDEITVQICSTQDAYEKMELFRKREELRSKKFSCTYYITADRVNKMIDKLIADEKLK